MNIIKMMVPKSMTVFVHENDAARQGLEILSRCGYTAIPVLDESEHYIGSVTEGDFLRRLLAEGTADIRALERCRIGDVIREDFCPSISIDSDADTVIGAILDQNYVPVVDSRNTFCGIVTRRRLIAYYAGREEPL